MPASDQGQRVETCCAKRRRKKDIEFNGEVCDKKIATMIVWKLHYGEN